MNRPWLEVTLVLTVTVVFALVGCRPGAQAPVSPAAAAAAEPPGPNDPRFAPDVTDCILLQLLPSHGLGFSSEGVSFTYEQKQALAAMFGPQVFYERYEIIHYDNWYPGLVAAIIVPGQANSFSYRLPNYRSLRAVAAGDPADPKLAGPEELVAYVWGFFPDMTTGRSPQAPGEAVVMESEGQFRHPLDMKGSDLGTPTAPRALGTRFRPACYRQLGTDFTAVGLTAPGCLEQETIWLRAFPAEPPDASLGGGPWGKRSSERASAFLHDFTNYERDLKAVIETGVRWRALRVRSGSLDATWRYDGYDYPVPMVSAELWAEDKPGSSLGLALSARVSRGGFPVWGRTVPSTELQPVPVAELEFVYDGKELAPSWTEGAREPVGGSLERGAQYRAALQVPRQEGPHRLEIYRNKRLLQVVPLEFRERQ